MKNIDTYIDSTLQEPQCTMISPGYKHPRNEDDMPIAGSKKIQRDPDHLIKLENTISLCMKTRYQEELLDTLKEKIPSLYIDCSQKGEDDIMFFILKEYIKQSKANDKASILSEVIGSQTITVINKSLKNDANAEEILNQYSQSRKALLQTSDNAQYKKSLLNIEAELTFQGLAKLLQQEQKKYLYLYLDKTKILSTDEQQRINTFLFARGSLSIFQDSYVRLKINNGNGVWKTRLSSTGHRVESPHDYSEVNIYEDDVKTFTS
ncbi:MAG: hypothetical protein WC606_04395 [Candidatus Absconditabacterales bacterium]